MKSTLPPTRSFLLGATLSIIGFVNVPSALAQGGWTDCASEGQTCNVYAPSTVRFGTDGEYAYRNVNGPVPCNNSVFGDPAKGESKRCSYRFGHNQSPDDRHPGSWGGSGWSGNNATNERGWDLCAREGDFCSFRGTREVRFGAAGRYAVRSVSGGTECSVAVFGDPNPGVRKSCEIHENSNWGGNYNRPPVSTDRGNWQFCADEGGYCRPPRGASVRFGTNGRYAYMNNVRGEVACDARDFGDPIRGERKRCEYSTDSGNGWNQGGGWGNDRPNGANAGNWVFCAQEDAECRVPYDTRVRFGANGRYNTLQVKGSVPCTPGAFGDPAKGERKRCEYDSRR